MIVVLTALSFNLMAECDMMGMVSINENYISNIEAEENNYDDPEDFFDFIREESSENNNPDGYGICFYNEGETLLYTEEVIDQNDQNPNIWTNNHRYFYSVGEGNYYNEIPNNKLPLDLAEGKIMNHITYDNNGYPDEYDNNNSNTIMVMGHARKGTGGYGNHPFYFNKDNTTYSFQHNGSLKDACKEKLYDFLVDKGWWNDHSSNWGDNYDSHNDFIDSEILFHYIMYFVESLDTDTKTAIETALNNVDVLGYNFRNSVLNPVPNSGGYYKNVMNFMLCDSENIYIFKNADDQDNSHELYYSNINDQFYAITTKSMEYYPTWTAIEQHNMVIFSNDNPPIVETIIDEDKDMFVLDAGYNWHGFPRMQEQFQDSENQNEWYQYAYNGTSTNPALLADENEYSIISDLDLIEGKRITRNNQDMVLDYDAVDNYWDDDNFSNKLFRHEGYKIRRGRTAEPIVFEVEGELRETQFEYSCQEGEKYWVCYTPTTNQNIEDAFGDQFDKVWSVKGEDWYYLSGDEIRGFGSGTSSSFWQTEGKTMVYGKTYEIRMWEDITFSWNTGREEGFVVTKSQPDNFEYEEKADYEAIDIQDFEGSEDITEIGVFEDEECVGATVVDSFPCQILAYTDRMNRDNTPLTFELVTGQRGSKKLLSDYDVLNWRTGKYESGLLISGKQEYSSIKFKLKENGSDISNNKIVHSCYPNPFNPDITISFTIPKLQNVRVDIYNLKGQKVVSLCNEEFSNGTHKITWNGKDANDKLVASGLYMYKIKTNNNTVSNKILLLK